MISPARYPVVPPDRHRAGPGAGVELCSTGHVVQWRSTSCQTIFDMNAKNILLDTAKKFCVPQTDMALAARVGVTRSAVSVWRKGGKITPEHLERLANAAHMDGEIVLRVMEEQAETPAQRRVWRSVLDRLSTAAAALTFAAIMIPAARSETLAAQRFAATAATPSVYYVIPMTAQAGLVPHTS